MGNHTTMADLEATVFHELLGHAGVRKLSEGCPMTDSRRVAKHFGKRHDDVLRKARKVIHDAGDFALRNFTECFENNALANGRPEPVYQMTKDGFMLLVMGFTGKEAARIKEAYISAFKTLEYSWTGSAQYLEINERLAEHGLRRIK